MADYMTGIENESVKKVAKLETRIQNKLDSLDNWNAESAVSLLPGEIAFVQQPEQTATTQEIYGDTDETRSTPTVAMKIGELDENGQPKSFKDLPWVSDRTAIHQGGSLTKGLCLGSTTAGAIKDSTGQNTVLGIDENKNLNLGSTNYSTQIKGKYSRPKYVTPNNNEGQDLALFDDLSTVAKTGNFNDLNNLPFYNSINISWDGDTTDKKQALSSEIAGVGQLTWYQVYDQFISSDEVIGAEATLHSLNNASDEKFIIGNTNIIYNEGESSGSFLIYFSDITLPAIFCIEQPMTFTFIFERLGITITVTFDEAGVYFLLLPDQYYFSQLYKNGKVFIPVDGTPISGSENLITSGGVYTANETLKDSLATVAKTGSYNDLNDKLCYEKDNSLYFDFIRWDGNTSSTTLGAVTTIEGITIQWYKVSDTVISIEALDGCEVLTSTEEDGKLSLETTFIRSNDGECPLRICSNNGSVQYGINIISVAQENDIISLQPWEGGTEISLTFAETGTYFSYMTIDETVYYIKSLYYYPYVKLPDYLLPDEAISKNYEDLYNKPFYTEIRSISWDPDYLDNYPITATTKDLFEPSGYPLTYYQVSPDIIKSSDIIGNSLYAINYGSEVKRTISESNIIYNNSSEDSFAIVIGEIPFVFCVKNPRIVHLNTNSGIASPIDLEFPAAGVYFLKNTLGFTAYPLTLEYSYIKKIDNKYLPINTNISSTSTDDEIPSSKWVFDALSTKANSDDVYTKEETDNKLSSVYHYKGTVDSYDNLPSDNEVGDVWNITNAYILGNINIKAGDNVAWTGTDWDILSGTVDLSAYALIDDIPTEAEKQMWNDKADGNHTHDTATTSTNGFLSSTDKAKLDTVAENANAYVHPSTHPASMITGLPSSLPANGGNADTVDNYHIRTAKEGDTGLAGYITFITE